MDDPLVGRRLANYRLERVIGRGGMAVVYQATDVALQRPVAVKIIDERFRTNPTYRQRFVQEARAAATWRHEHILQVYYAGEQDGITFFAMELIDGQTLADVLSQAASRGERLPYAEVVRYGRAVASALDYAHQRGVIHRDVKPSNVLVSTDGRVILSDFGLALDVQQGSMGEVFGTAHYTAPEQARRSSSAVPESDFYSLGVILYEMLTGTVPFDDPSPTSVALQHLTLPPPPPRQLNPDLSEEVESVLLKALAKQPADRYPDGNALMHALEEALANMTPGAWPRPMPTARLVKAPAGAVARRRQLPAWILYLAAGAGAFILLGLLISGLVNSLPGRQVQAVTQAAPTGRAVVIPRVQPTALPTVTPTSLPASQTPDRALQATAALPINTTETPAMIAETPPGPTMPVPSPTWTPRYSGGRRMVLYWNETSFYMLQTSGFGDLIEPLAFERVDAQGQAAQRYSGKLWAEYHSATLRDWCMRLEIGGTGSQHLNPAQCQDRYLASRWPQAGETTLFWTPQDGSVYFRVLWGREELQRCEIKAGTCEVFLP